MAEKSVLYENGKFKTGAGGGGSSTLAGLTDTNIVSPSDGQVLGYNGTSAKWENVNSETLPFSVVNGKVCITYTTA